jgi:hypothetical protein
MHREKHSVRFLCLTSKMSHDLRWRGSCSNRWNGRALRSVNPSIARGVTDVDVGPGALLGLRLHRLSSSAFIRPPLSCSQRLISDSASLEYQIMLLPKTTIHRGKSVLFMSATNCTEWAALRKAPTKKTKANAEPVHPIHFGNRASSIID